MLPSFQPLICFVTRLNIVGFENIEPPTPVFPSFSTRMVIHGASLRSSTHSSVYTVIVPVCKKLSVLQPRCNCNICRELKIPDKLMWVEDSTLERSANFLTFLHHKFSHFPINLSNFQIFKEVFQLS